jgi:hypothetical protein
METDLSQVSLGFAEFVGQVLRETFEAVTGAQAHQTERVTALLEALELSPPEFQAKFLEPQDLQAAEISLFGEALTERMRLTGRIEEQIRRIVPEAELADASARGTLSASGFQLLRRLALENAVAESKARMRAEVNQLGSTRLVVDSGEVKVKLELSNLYQSEATQPPADSGTPTSGTRERPNPAKPPDIPSPPDPVREAREARLAFRDIQKEGLIVREVTDSVSSQKTVLLDRAGLQALAAGRSVPDLRLVATPARQNSSSNVLSEVTIRFKTV